jgi:hypothetical protein
MRRLLTGCAALATAALWAASSAQAGFYISACKQFAHITKAECRDQNFRDAHTIEAAHLLDSKRELGLLTEALQHFAAPVRTKMKSKIPTSAPKLPFLGDTTSICFSYENSRNELIKALREALIHSCEEKGASCPFAKEKIWDIAILRYANAFYAVLTIEKEPIREYWLINQDLQKLTTLPYVTLFEPTSGILRMEGKGVTYIQLAPDSAKIIASFTENIPNTPQIEYEMNINYDPRVLQARCPMLIID